MIYLLTMFGYDFLQVVYQLPQNQTFVPDQTGHPTGCNTENNSPVVFANYNSGSPSAYCSSPRSSPAFVQPVQHGNPAQVISSSGMGYCDNSYFR